MRVRLKGKQRKQWKGKQRNWETEEKTEVFNKKRKRLKKKITLEKLYEGEKTEMFGWKK